MELKYLTISKAVEALQKGTLTSVELTNYYLHRIATLEPKLNSFVTVCKDQVLAQAGNADKLIKLDPKIFEQKPLLGLPMAIKDNFSTNGIQTTASSSILKGYVPPFDSTVVAKLKESGALILGKANMDAFAHGSSTETSDFGSSKNPWDVGRLPGGSSGGSASAVASDETIAAIGSETAGSIRQPASWCGVVGLKPTYGRVSRFGVIAMASSTDSPGPITRNVSDADLIYRLIAGFDPKDATTAQKDLKKMSTNFDLSNVKIGLPKEYFRDESQNGVNQTVMDAVKVLEKLGAKIVDLTLFDPKYAISVYTIIQRSEVSSNLARFDGIRFGGDRSLFNDENKRRIMLGTYTLSSGYYDAYYKKAQQVRTLIVSDFAKAFEKVDLIIGPTSPTVAQKVGATAGQDMYGELADILVEPSSIAGLPGLNLPCGFVENLPVGMQLIGPQWSEDVLLSVGHQFETNSEWHLKTPTI